MKHSLQWAKLTPAARPAASKPDRAGSDEPSDDGLLARIASGDPSAFEPLMRRYNQRLYRVARGIVRDSVEAEDVVQQAFLSAFANLHQFNGEARLSTWLTRITINEGLARRRRSQRDKAMSETPNVSDWQTGGTPPASAEDRVASAELTQLVESAIETLPESARLMFLLREVQGLSTAETAEALETTEGNVRVTLHRVRAQLQQALLRTLGDSLPEVYAFAGERCDRIVDSVFAQLGNNRRGEPPTS